MKVPMCPALRILPIVLALQGCGREPEADAPAAETPEPLRRAVNAAAELERRLQVMPKPVPMPVPPACDPPGGKVPPPPVVPRSVVPPAPL